MLTTWFSSPSRTSTLNTTSCGEWLRLVSLSISCCSLWVVVGWKPKKRRSNNINSSSSCLVSVLVVVVVVVLVVVVVIILVYSLVWRRLVPCWIDSVYPLSRQSRLTVMKSPICPRRRKLHYVLFIVVVVSHRPFCRPWFLPSDFAIVCNSWVSLANRLVDC